MSGKSAMTDPAEDVPADNPPRHNNAHLCFGTESPPMGGTRLIRTMNEFAYQMQRTIKREDAMMPVVANGHPAATNRTEPILNVQHQLLENRFLWPTIRHGYRLLANPPPQSHAILSNCLTSRNARISLLSDRCFLMVASNADMPTESSQFGWVSLLLITSGLG